MPSSLAACDLLPPAIASARRICSSSPAGLRSGTAGVSGASHSDCVALNISLWMDGEELIRDGRIVQEELAKLAEGLV